MIFSIWNYGAKRYDYYRAGKPTGTHAGAPTERFGKSALGATPEQLAWTMPGDATFIGSGSVARGRIATKDGTLGLLGDVDAGDLPMYLIAAGLVYVAWRSFR